MTQPEWQPTDLTVTGDATSRTILVQYTTGGLEANLLMTPQEARETAAKLLAAAAKAEGL